MSGQQTYFPRTERIDFRVWTAEEMLLAVGIWDNRRVTRLIADLGNLSEAQARAVPSRQGNDEKGATVYVP